MISAKSYGEDAVQLTQFSSIVSSIQKIGIYERSNFYMYVHMQCAYTCERPEQYLDGSSVRVEEGVVAILAQGPAHPQELL